MQVRLDESHDGHELRTSLGTEVHLLLPENRTTGYRWHLVADGHPTLSLKADRYDAAGTAPGQGGIRHWTFSAAERGRSELHAVYRRPWESAEASGRSFRAVVIVSTQ